MTRVATHGNYQSALLSLMTAQGRAQQAQERIDSEKIATDMSGYGRGAEQLTSLTSTQARLDGFIATGESAAARLSAQDLALTRIYEGGDGARDAIANSLGAGDITNLMTELGLHYQTVQGGLNAEHQGSYLFAGGQGDTAPATAATMADLAAAPSTASPGAGNAAAKPAHAGGHPSAKKKKAKPTPKPVAVPEPVVEAPPTAEVAPEPEPAPIVEPEPEPAPAPSSQESESAEPNTDAGEEFELR